MGKNKVIMYVLYVIVIAVLVYAAVVTRGFGIWKNKTVSATNYQAVFLSNGQVYFGKLTDSGKYAKLEDIYYLQVQQVQPTDKTAAQQSKVTLIKLGNELHAPQDRMEINRDQILFIEDLKDEGKVMQAIKRYKETGPDITSTNTTDVNTQK